MTGGSHRVEHSGVFDSAAVHGQRTTPYISISSSRFSSQQASDLLGHLGSWSRRFLQDSQVP
jgi:hypothetical protein